MFAFVAEVLKIDSAEEAVQLLGKGGRGSIELEQVLSFSQVEWRFTTRQYQQSRPRAILRLHRQRIDRDLSASRGSTPASVSPRDPSASRESTLASVSLRDPLGVT